MIILFCLAYAFIGCMTTAGWRDHFLAINARACADDYKHPGRPPQVGTGDAFYSIIFGLAWPMVGVYVMVTLYYAAANWCYRKIS